VAQPPARLLSPPASSPDSRSARPARRTLPRLPPGPARQSPPPTPARHRPRLSRWRPEPPQGLPASLTRAPQLLEAPSPSPNPARPLRNPLLTPTGRGRNHRNAPAQHGRPRSPDPSLSGREPPPASHDATPQPPPQIPSPPPSPLPRRTLLRRGHATPPCRSPGRAAQRFRLDA